MIGAAILRVSCGVLSIAVLGASCPAQSAPDVSADEQIARLRVEIARHDELYFKRAAPEISDFAYDELKRELARLERAFPGFATAGVSANAVGDDRTGSFPTQRHRQPMLSIEKAYSDDELRAFDARIAQRLERDALIYVIEPKVDGIAINITYEKGMLVRAVTRGDGSEGDDITANVSAMASVPQELAGSSPGDRPVPLPELIELRGEIFLTFEEFERINREKESAGEPAFANPRNLAAGSARLLDTREVADRGLSIVFHGAGACEPSSIIPGDYHGFRELLAAWSLPVLEPFWIAHGADEMLDAVDEFQKVRRTLAFPTDGAVVKLDSIALQQQLGANAEAPRWAIARKFQLDRAETRVLAITIQVGRTGILTPVAALEPVNIAGSTVTRASLHNREYVVRHDIRVGDFVHVEKAGEIIPQIVSVNIDRRPRDAQPFAYPETCPACGTAVEQTERGVALRCANPLCSEKLRRRLEHFASSSCADMDGLGSATIEALVERGWVKDIADLYRLDRERLVSLGRSGDASTDKLLAAIERSKNAPLWRIINGLGIPRVGPASARNLARVFESLGALAAAKESDFSPRGRVSAAGIGSATTNSIKVYLGEPRNRAQVAELHRIVSVTAPEPAIQSPLASAPLKGRLFVLTGRLPTLTRTEATHQIERAGGTVSDDVSRKTDYLLSGADPGANLDRAKELGIRVIDEAALLEMLESR